MIRNQILGFSIGLALGVSGMAAAVIADEAKEAKGVSYANQIVGLQKRVYELEGMAAMDAKWQVKTSAWIGELQRKVEGMQKQITLLHGKKADKWTPERVTEEEKKYIEKNMGTDK